MRKIVYTGLGVAILTMALISTYANPPELSAAGPQGRYIVVAKSDGDYDGLKQDAQKSGAKVLREMRDTGTFVISASSTAKSQLTASTHAAGLAKDGIRQLVRPAMAQDLFGWNAKPGLHKTKLDSPFKKKINPDPAFSVPGLMWNVFRIEAPDAWKITSGDPGVKVGVADTGLDFTHSELASQVASVVDLTDPTLCKDNFQTSDADLAALYGGPVNTDWNGHGSWIGGNIAAALDGQGINGIAPKIKLVALKISEWCGYAYDSSIINAFLYAANHEIDIVSISFGGYLDRTDPDQDLAYTQYVNAVSYARRKGTLIVAAAGNEHARIGMGGQVLSHGTLTTPGDPLADYFGQYEVPGGIPGVVDVSATGNVVNAASASCAPGTVTTFGKETCKPKSDPHQPIGVGRQNQLTYYSNFGPRIDVAAPGGARKFNQPNYARGGTPGYPVTTDDGTNVWEDFSITSNWATEISCYTFTGGGFPADQCYSTIQGTSMATPHASAVLALLASRSGRHRPDDLVRMLKDSAQDIHGNATPGLSATDKSVSDATGVACPTGYCYLGGPAISDHEAYGAGLVDAFRAVK